MGQEVFVNPELGPEETKDIRYVEIKPWFRLTPCPEND